jgi:carboxyl-terminal processing protease
VTLSELLLSIFAGMGALFVVAWRRPGRTLWRAIAIAGALLVIVTVATGRHRVESLPMTVVAAVIALISFHRSRLPADHTLRPRGWFVAALRWLVAVTVALSIVIDAAFITIFDPLSNAPYRELFAGEESEDFSRLAWPEAFEHLHAHLSHAYAMGEWKRIDWRSLHQMTAPKVAAAAAADDTVAYATALREYLWSLHDGHVGLAGAETLRVAATQGGYGFALIRLDDGRTIAHVVIDQGPAAAQGMRWGATVLSWNGVSIDEAVARTSVLWNASPPATAEGLQLARLRQVARARVGTRATVVFRNLDESNPRTVTLAAIHDDFEPLKRAGQRHMFSLKDRNIDTRVLPGAVGYVKIRAELPTLPQLLPERVVRLAVERFVRAGVHGVVLDVRGNFGGADKLVPSMMGFFVDRRDFYESATLYRGATQRFEREAISTLWTEPRTPRLAVPVVVLVDASCVSSGEGFAMVARRMPGSHVVGCYGTYGSFGISGAEVKMPAGLTVEYPNGQSVDERGQIQVDSDWRMEGGIAPDVRVPVTLENVRAQFREGRDVVLETAVKILEDKR